MGVILDLHDHGVAAGDHQTEKGRLQLRVGQIVGGDVTPDMVYRNQGLVHSHSGGLGEVYTHQHGTDEAGGIGHCHGINLLSGKASPLQRLIGKAIDGFDMLSGSNLRHHTAIDPVQIHLRGDAVTQYLPAIPDDGHRSFIAGGFYS